tara:strand:+ start:5716 stop:7218 length:1503 start_codon:yes stop_codon:yes gene_type:complete
MAFSSKIIPKNKLSIIRKKNKTKKIALCHGVFDIVHPGHLAHFKEVRKSCDILVVSITEDKFIKKKRIISFNNKTRLEQLSSHEIIDYVVSIDHETALPAIRYLKPDFYAKGNEYQNLQSDPSRNIFSEKRELEKNGGQLIFTDERTYSSTKIGYFLNNQTEVDQQNKNNIINFNYKNINDSSFSLGEIKDALIRLKGLKVAIIGETILDEWVKSDLVGTSEKSNCSVIKTDTKIKQFGGASIVAQHLDALGVNVSLYTNFKVNNFKKNFKCYKISNKSEIKKTRFLNNNSNEVIISIQEIPKSSNEQKYISKSINKINNNKYDLIIIADYGHGVVPDNILQKIKKTNFIAATAQANTINFGYNLVDKYMNANMIFANINEASLQTKLEKSKSKEEIFNKFCKNMGNDKIILMTLGNKGSMTKKFKNKEIITPSITKSGIETIGCGDAFLALTSSIYIATKNEKLASFIGSIASGYIANDIGNHSSPNIDDFINISKIIL